MIHDPAAGPPREPHFDEPTARRPECKCGCGNLVPFHNDAFVDVVHYNRWRAASRAAGMRPCDCGCGAMVPKKARWKKRIFVDADHCRAYMEARGIKTVDPAASLAGGRARASTGAMKAVAAMGNRASALARAARADATNPILPCKCGCGLPAGGRGQLYASRAHYFGHVRRRGASPPA